MDKVQPASHSVELLHRMAQVIEAEGGRWAAIGALAAAYHGLVRASLDADALITLRGARIDLETLAGKILGLNLNRDLLLSLCQGFGAHEAALCRSLLDSAPA